MNTITRITIESEVGILEITQEADIFVTRDKGDHDQIIRRSGNLITAFHLALSTLRARELGMAEDFTEVKFGG